MIYRTYLIRFLIVFKFVQILIVNYEQIFLKRKHPNSVVILESINIHIPYFVWYKQYWYYWIGTGTWIKWIFICLCRPIYGAYEQNKQYIFTLFVLTNLFYAMYHFTTWWLIHYSLYYSPRCNTKFRKRLF